MDREGGTFRRKRIIKLEEKFNLDTRGGGGVAGGRKKKDRENSTGQRLKREFTRNEQSGREILSGDFLWKGGRRPSWRNPGKSDSWHPLRVIQLEVIK